MTTTKRYRPMDPVNTLGSRKKNSFLNDEESGMEEEEDRITLSSINSLKAKKNRNIADLSNTTIKLDLEVDESPLGPLLNNEKQNETQEQNIFSSMKEMPGDYEILRILFNDFSLTNEDCWIKLSMSRNDVHQHFMHIYVYKHSIQKLIEVKVDSYNHYSSGYFAVEPKMFYVDAFVHKLPNRAAYLSMPLCTDGLLRLELKPLDSFRRPRIDTYFGFQALHKVVVCETYERALELYQKFTQKNNLASMIANSSSKNDPLKPAIVDVDQKPLDQYRLRRAASVNTESRIRANTSSYFSNMTNSNRLLGFTTSSPEASRRKSGGGIDWALCEPAPVANPQLLFIYPDDLVDKTELGDSFGSVAITSAELPRLELGIFLNDRLIDFDLMHTHQAYALRPDVHVFCSLFFRELKTMGREGVRMWTPKDLFSKRFLVIPVNEYLHWYLVIICNAQRLLVEITKRTKKRELLTVGSSEEEGELEEMETIRPDDKCFILILDSLGSRARPNTIETLTKYLAAEALEKHNVQINPKLLMGISPKVPQQNNHTDCGLFLLEFFERFIGKPEEFEERALQRTGNFYFGLKTWFQPESASQRREALKAKVLEHQSRYQQSHPVQSEPMPESASSDLEIIE